MAEFNPEKFLATPIDAFDFQFMIGDVRDFLELSENTIDWQYRRELQAISHFRDLDDYPPGYREHLKSNAAHRFEVSLALRVRCGALVAFTTSVEWAIGHLNRSALTPVPDLRDGTNHTVKVMREFATQAAVDSGGAVEDYEASYNWHVTPRVDVYVAVENVFDETYLAGRAGVDTVGQPRFVHGGIRISR